MKTQKNKNERTNERKKETYGRIDYADADGDDDDNNKMYRS